MTSGSAAGTSEPGTDSPRPTLAEQRRARWDIALFWALLAGLTVALAAFLARTLTEPDLWFDEAGQFWLSRGQFHYSPLGHPDESVWTGLGHARSGSNLDPPGFTVLLWLWTSALGTAPAILRLLPLIAFLLSLVVGMVLGVRELRLPKGLTLGVCLAVLVTPLTLTYAVEVRAYSAEVLAVLLAALSVLRYARLPSSGRLAVLVLVLLAGSLLTRYSFVYVFAGVVAAAAGGAKVRGARLPRVHLVVLVVTLLLTTVGLAWYSRATSGIGAPSYVTGLLLKGASPEGFVRAVAHSLVVWPHIVTAAFLVTGALAAWRWRRTRPITGRRGSILVALAFVVGYEAAAITISALGSSPWFGTVRWSIGLTAVAGVSALALTALCAEVLPRRSGSVPRIIVVGLVGVVIVAAVSSLLLAARFRPADTSLHNGYNHGLTAALTTPAEAAPDTVLVSSWLWPAYRYITERSGEPVDPSWSGASLADAPQLPTIVTDACRTAGRPTTVLLQQDAVDDSLRALEPWTDVTGGCEVRSARFEDVTVLRIAPVATSPTG